MARRQDWTPRYPERRLGFIQELYLGLVENSSFNAMDGVALAEWLRENGHLWKSVIIVQSSGPGITLRDLPQHNNADTVFILTRSEDNALKIARIAKDHWYADEVQVMDPRESGRFLGGGDGIVVRLWWD